MERPLSPPESPPAPRRQQGITLIEIMVVLTIVILMTKLALPSLGAAYSNSRARGTLQRLGEDFATLRNVATRGSHSSVTLTLRGDCSWVASIDGNATAAASALAGSLSSDTLPNGLSCTGTLPLTFNFNSRGGISPSANFTFHSPTGQSWPIQVIGSGTVFVSTGAS